MTKLLNRRGLLHMLPAAAVGTAMAPVAVALDGEILPPVQHKFGAGQAAAVQADTLEEALEKLRNGKFVMVDVE